MKKLTILTTASQQIALIDVSALLSGVPPWTYRHQFFPNSFKTLLYPAAVGLASLIALLI
jgi:hypothetical protein